MTREFHEKKMTVDLDNLEIGIHYLTELLTNIGDMDTCACILRDSGESMESTALYWMQSKYDAMRSAAGLAGCFLDIISAGLANDEISIAAKPQETNTADKTA